MSAHLRVALYWIAAVSTMTKNSPNSLVATDVFVTFLASQSIQRISYLMKGR